MKEYTGQKYLFIDNAKFIGIFLVIFGHTLQLLQLTDNNLICKQIWNYIYLFHMPLFFIISGFLYKKKELTVNINKIVFGLLIPYLIYQILYFPFAYGSYVFNNHYLPFNTFIKCILGILTGDFVPSQYSLPVCGPCWFIVAIINIRLLCNYINLTTKNIIMLIVAAICILKSLIIANVDLFFCIDNTVMAIPYFFLGHLIQRYISIKNIQICSKFKKFILSILSLAIPFIVLTVVLKYNGLMTMNLKINKTLQDKSLLLSYFAGIAGSYSVLYISHLFRNRYKFIDVISKNTLFIIFYHFLLLFILAWCKYRLLLHMFHSTLTQIIFSLVTTFLILIISYLTILILDKYLPIVLGKKNP